METEHTYAPPFSSAKDPIAIGGYVASNIISVAMPVISWRELVEEKGKVMLIDTRTPEEFSFGTIPGAVNIPLDEMREHLAEMCIRDRYIPDVTDEQMRQWEASKALECMMLDGEKRYFRNAGPVSYTHLKKKLIPIEN